MPRRTLDALMEVIDALKADGITPESRLEWNFIMNHVRIKVGTDPRTVGRAESLLKEFRLVVEDGSLWRVDFERAYELML